MNIRISSFLLVFLTTAVSAQYCGSSNKLKACKCKKKVGYITSPYDTGNLHCQWQIYAEKKGHVVLLESEHIDIFSTGDCSSDYLEMFDGADNTSRSLGRWCKGSLSVESSGRDMLLMYRTDEFRKGSNSFTLTYKAKTPTWGIGTILAIAIPLSVFVPLVIFLIIRWRKVGCSNMGSGWSGGGGGGWGGGGGGDCGGDGGGC